MAQRYMHFSAFLPLFLLCREKILCFFLLLLSFKTNLEAYPLLLSCLLNVLLLLFSLQPQTILSHARFTPSLFRFPANKKRSVRCYISYRPFRSNTLDGITLNLKDNQNNIFSPVRLNRSLLVFTPLSERYHFPLLLLTILPILYRIFVRIAPTFTH